MKRGFTLIELLVASLLLGLLVSILTTIFSQSSIAWSTATANVKNAREVRRDVSDYERSADALLSPNGLSVASVFNGMTGQSLRDRAFLRSPDSSKGSGVDIRQVTSWNNLSVGGATASSGPGAIGNGDAYVIGVSSDGPDRQPHTWDDITTWPPDNAPQ